MSVRIRSILRPTASPERCRHRPWTPRDHLLGFPLCLRSAVMTICRECCNTSARESREDLAGADHLVPPEQAVAA